MARKRGRKDSHLCEVSLFVVFQSGKISLSTVGGIGDGCGPRSCLGKLVEVNVQLCNVFVSRKNTTFQDSLLLIFCAGEVSRSHA